MLANPQDEKKLRRDIYALRRALRADIKDIRVLIKQDSITPDIAVRKMSKLEAQMREKSVSKMSKQELVSTYRQLKYIRGLKSSTVEGAKETASHYEDIAPKLKNLSKSQIKKFWDTYEHLTDISPLYKYMKYEIFSGLADVVAKMNLSSEELGQAIDQLYQKSVEGELDNEPTDKKTRLLLQSFKPIL